MISGDILAIIIAVALIAFLGITLPLRYIQDNQRCDCGSKYTRESRWVTGHWTQQGHSEIFTWCNRCEPDKYGIYQYRADKDWIYGQLSGKRWR